MSVVHTILYEDAMRGSGGVFPPHDFVLSMVGEALRSQRPGEVGDIWGLRRRVEARPQNGVGKLIAAVGTTDLLAGAGELFALVDRDEVGKHLRLGKGASDQQVVSALRARSDAPAKLHVHFLDPNLEGLLRTLLGCGLPGEMPVKKDLNTRDILFGKAAHSVGEALRSCVRAHQKSLAEMVDTIASLLSTSAAPLTPLR